MLLHSEVEIKSHPHPERPDRLRAIAASLATAGIFPGRCYPISAREITKEELQRVKCRYHIPSTAVPSRMYHSKSYTLVHIGCPYLFILCRKVDTQLKMGRV
ncbi:hypothetical protein M9H77_28952 [Catharanthus roseus]|uniref:Uncharacterized protein n=1 Tax=Catharanthus roseus TaxID=4058 RepID=A0ACC0AH57_CATRO|nr:hypothetical protein M9H77_28952 [Catharanthus roseus]